VDDEARRTLPAQRGHPDGSRSPADIEAELTATRERLASTVDTLLERVQPKAIAARGAERVKLLVLTPNGRPRTKRIAAAAVVLAAVCGLVLARRWGATRHATRRPGRSSARRSTRRRRGSWSSRGPRAPALSRSCAGDP
jgi:hypothetical protein